MFLFVFVWVCGLFDGGDVVVDCFVEVVDYVYV